MPERPGAGARLCAALPLIVAAALGLGAQPSAEAVLGAEAPGIATRLEEERVVLLRQGGDADDTVVALVLFNKPQSRVGALLREAERQPEYRPELVTVRTVQQLPDGRIDEQRIKILFTELVYRLRYHDAPGTGRLSWRLDDSFDNDIARMQGFWELHDFDHGSERTLGRFGSDVDVGSGVPRFLQSGWSRKTVLRYVQNVQRWIDSDGRWRP
jgi:hypothetical protein